MSRTEITMKITRKKLRDSNLTRFDKVLSKIFDILEIKLTPTIDASNPYTYESEWHDSIKKECMKFIDALDISSIQSDQKRHKVFIEVLDILKTFAVENLTENLDNFVWTMIEAQDRYRDHLFYEEKIKIRTL